MKKEILAGVIGALITAFILWLVGAFDKKLTDVQLEFVSNKVASNPDFTKRMQQQLPASVSVDDRSQTIRVGDIQICWGTVDGVSHLDGNEWRTANGVFDKPFTSTPQVVVTSHPETSKEAKDSVMFSPYVSKATHTNLQVHLRAYVMYSTNRDPMIFREAKVRLDYVAIGKWR